MIGVATQRRTYGVSEIHCSGCEDTIVGALAHVDGIEQVEPIQSADEVIVSFDPDRIDEGRIRRLLSEAGFPVRSPTGSVSDRRTSRSGSRRDLEEGADDEEARGASAGRYALLVVAVLAVALAGYVGYVLYPRFDLPRVEGVGVLGLAAAAGIASFFSPCSFPLLLGLLGRQAAGGAHADERARPAVFGGALAIGAGSFLLLLGAVIAIGGTAMFAGVVFDSPAGIALRSVVGVLLILLGLVQTGLLPISMHAVTKAARPITRRQARLRRDRPVAGFALFGFGYVLAGFG